MVDNADEDGDALSFNHLVPIGAIIPWAKSFNNVPSIPDAWLECDGSVISDSESPMNGETLPDLNGNNNFLRGNTTSGGTGGSTSTGGATGAGQFDDNADGALPNMALHVHSGNEPPFYDVVWIMRIK